MRRDSGLDLVKWLAMLSMLLDHLRYHSVRSTGNICWALMTPRPVTSIIQSAHYEMIWSGQIISVSRITTIVVE